MNREETRVEDTTQESNRAVLDLASDPLLLQIPLVGVLGNYTHTLVSQIIPQGSGDGLVTWSLNKKPTSSSVRKDICK